MFDYNITSIYCRCKCKLCKTEKRIVKLKSNIYYKQIKYSDIFIVQYQNKKLTITKCFHLQSDLFSFIIR